MQRRSLLIGASALALPRFAIAQADDRPTVTVAVQKISNSNTLDCLREQSNVGTRLTTFFVERLIDLNYRDQLQPVPGLATAWRRIDDRTVEFDLRRGVRVHNGDEFTSADVLASFSPNRMFGETLPKSQGKTIELSAAMITRRTRELPAEIPPVGRRFFPALDHVEAVDNYTVRFVNATPDVTLEGRLSTTASGIVSGRAFDEASSWLDYARKPVGTGPYKIRSYIPDVSLTMDAHDDYWGGRPPIKTLILVEVPETSARINGLITGQYQFACDLPPDQIAGVEGHAGYEVLGGTIPNMRLTTFDKNHPTLMDPKVRLAMAHAIDRKSIVDSLWDERTVVPAGLQWPFYDKMFVQGWTVPEYDPAKARALLKQTGYKGDPIPYRLLNNYYTNQVANSQILVENWREIGLNVAIEMKENWTQILERGNNRGIRDWSNSAAFNDPVSSIVSQHGPNGEQQQYGEWTNAEMNTLSYELETSTDMARRHAVFARMLQICEREDPAYTVLHQNATFTGKQKATKWRAAPSFAMDFRTGNWG